MSGPAIIIGPLNGVIVAYVIGTWIGDGWSKSAQNMWLVLGGVVGLLITIWLINDDDGDGPAVQVEDVDPRTTIEAAREAAEEAARRTIESEPGWQDVDPDPAAIAAAREAAKEAARRILESEPGWQDEWREQTRRDVEDE